MSYERCQMIRSLPLAVLTLCSRDDDIVTTHVDFEFFQRPRWWSTDVLSVQVVLPVVASAPDLFSFRSVLHDAFQMRAHSRESLELSGRCMHQDAGLVAELENFPGVNRHLTQFRGDHRVFR